MAAGAGAPRRAPSTAVIVPVPQAMSVIGDRRSREQKAKQER